MKNAVNVFRKELLRIKGEVSREIKMETVILKLQSKCRLDNDEKDELYLRLKRLASKLAKPNITDQHQEFEILTYRVEKTLERGLIGIDRILAMSDDQIATLNPNHHEKEYTE